MHDTALFYNSLNDKTLPSHTRLYATWLKRLLDLMAIMLIAPPALVVMAVAALLIRASGSQPFFGHRRVGRNGRVFTCWKLQTMHPDAERLLARHLAENPEAAAEWARHHKLTRDPRVTRLGRFLRKTSLDELPQILNVLRGEMSLVGPRPITEAELALYGEARVAYLAVTPGITGLWQVRGRNALSFDERAALDLHYVATLTLLLDLAILLATVPAVLRIRG